MNPRQQSKPTWHDIAPVRGCVLVVDADRDTLQIISEQLTALDFEVLIEESMTVSRIESRLERGDISGILMELPSPVTGTLTVLLERMRDRHSDISAIVMSRAANIEGLRRAVELGAREYLVKPFDAELLKTKCLQVFRSAEQRT